MNQRNRGELVVQKRIAAWVGVYSAGKQNRGAHWQIGTKQGGKCAKERRRVGATGDQKPRRVLKKIGTKRGGNF